MAAPPVPSNSNNWPKGLISRPDSLHSCALIFDSFAPKSTKAVTSQLSMTTGASLACPTNHATGSRFRNGIGVIPFHPFWLTAFSWVSFGSGSQRKCLELTADCWRGVWPHSLGSPLPYLMVLLELHTSLAMWPQPWHLQHCRELEPQAPCVPPCTPFCACWFPLHGDLTPALLVTEELQAEVVWPRPVWPLWEFGWTEVFLSICPLPWPLCLGILGALAGQLPCSAVVKAVISLAIWFPSSFELEGTSVVAADLTLTFVSSILLSALLASTTSSE